MEVIRRAKPIVGEEVVDIEYRMFDGSAMLSAEHIVKTLNRLSEAELVTTLKYAVRIFFFVLASSRVFGSGFSKIRKRNPCPPV